MGPASARAGSSGSGLFSCSDRSVASVGLVRIHFDHALPVNPIAKQRKRIDAARATAVRSGGSLFNHGLGVRETASGAALGSGLGDVISGDTTGGAISDAEGTIISPLQLTQSMGLPERRT